MNFGDSKIFKALSELPFHKVAAHVLDLSESGRDVNQKDGVGRNFLHHIALNGEKFSPSQAVPVIYQLALAGIDLDCLDDEGDTALHKIVRYDCTHRILVALIRCGADLTIKNRSGKTAEEILTEVNGPPNSNPMLFWYEQFKPGLREAALSGDVATTERLLKSWCRTRYWRGGRRHCVIADVTAAGDVPNKAEILRLLEQHQHTTELAVSTLACSIKRISSVIQTGGADINTQDVSYTYHYPNSPRVPQPLLAAAWELDNYDVIDLLMKYQPDTSLMYVNHRWKQPMPLFFHVMSGKPKPNKMNIITRIIRGSDLSRTNSKGQTILFCAIKENMPLPFIKGLLKYGVDITSRDNTGQTARDYALNSFRDDCVECLDKQVLENLRSRSMSDLDHYAMRGYGDILTTIISLNNDESRAINHDLIEKRSMKQVAEILDGLPKLQKQMLRACHAINEQNLKLVTRLVTKDNYSYQNWCGQTLLHWAVLKCNHDVMTWLCKTFPKIINISDNLLRSAFHYAVCLYGKESQEVRMLHERGASWDVKDCLGRTPGKYGEACMETVDHEDMRRGILQFYTKVYVTHTNFDFRLKTAVATGSREAIEVLMEEAAQHEINLGDYSDVLFDCIDMHRPGTALYLIDQGADPEVYARYEACDPDDVNCLEKKCRHPIVSLQERAEEMGYEPMAKYIDKYKSGQATPLTSHSQRTALSGALVESSGLAESAGHSAASSRFTGRSNLSTPFSEMTNFGSFM